MNPVRINDEVTIDAKSHPVFSVVHILSSNKHTLNPFENLGRCPGITTSDPKGHRECRQSHGKDNRLRIDNHIGALYKESSFQYDNLEFTNRIQKFLETTHCKDHRGFARDRLNKLIKEMREGGQQVKSATRPDGDVDRDSIEVGPLASDPQDVNIAEDLSGLSIHPSQESDISFNSTSDADTVLTTPDATPLSHIEQILTCDPESRPETPCPTPRQVSDEVVQLDNLPSRIESSDSKDEESDDSAEDPAPYPDAKTMSTPNYKRLTQTIGKLPLMHAIYHHWTPMDSKRGRLYIWTHDQHPDIIKIGWSASTGGSAHRHAQPGNCYAVNTTPIWESPEAFVGAYRIERIVHGQLKENNVVREVACGSPRCAVKGTRHREWFRCDPKVAEEQIALWTGLMANGFYETINSSGSGGEAEVDVGEMEISAKGQQILNRLCDISPSSVLRDWHSVVPEDVTPVTDLDSQCANDSTASVDRGDQLLSSVSECVESTAADSGPEPSRQGLDAGLQASQSLPNLETASKHEEGPPPQSRGVRFRNHLRSLRKSLGRSDSKMNVLQLIRHKFRHADEKRGGGPSLEHDEDMFVRLYGSVFVKEFSFSLKRRY